MTLASLAFEALVCVLLLAAAVMCWRVDRRLRALRNGQDGLRGTIQALNDAVDRARASLAALDRAAKEGGDSLREEVRQAQKLADELRFLSSEADGHAERITTRPRRGSSSRELEPVADVELSEEEAEAQRSRRRLNALKALR